MAQPTGVSRSDGDAQKNDDIQPGGTNPATEETRFSETRGVLRQFGSALRHDIAAASQRARSRLRGDAPRPPRQRRSVWLRTLRGVTLIAVTGVIALAIILAWALRGLPWEEIADGSLKPIVVLEDANGERLVSQGPLQGAYASFDEFPEHLVEAVIAAEDRRFYEHSGIDLRGIARAFFANVKSGGIVEGGSTITQQLVKISYLESDRTFKRKIQEAVVALWLEQKLGKNEILARYLNNVYMGAGATGMPAAAQVYFDKELSELDLAESAMLAGLIRAPSQLNPLVNPEGARKRTATVLQAMVESGSLEPEAAEEAKTQFAELHPTRPAARSGSWFADWVIGEAREIAGPHRGTIEVRTSLMPNLQAIAENVVTEALEREGAAVGASQAALVAMTPEGAVVAMVGGRDYEESEYNRAVTARRQPGSAFKLFTYYAALKHGLTPDDTIEDAPVKIGDWEPENYSEEYRGVVTLEEAFASSLNAATVALAQEVGFDNVVAAARELGIDAELGDRPSVALGTYEVSLLDLTGAYASVRAGKAPIEPWGIASFHADDQPRAFSVQAPKQPDTDLRPWQPSLVRLLQAVVQHGTGKAAQLPGFAAGKTGTSQNFRDAWFIGFTEPLVVGVWVGNDDDTPMDEVTGGKLPAEIWRNFMIAAMRELGVGGEGEMLPPSAAPDEPQPLEEAEEPDMASVQEQSASEGKLIQPLQQEVEVGANGRTSIIILPRQDGRGQPSQQSLEQEPLEQVSPEEQPLEEAPLEEPPLGEEPLEEQPVEQASTPGSCDIEACSRYYQSFRASDCTYQPYEGPRRLCTVSGDDIAGAGDPSVEIVGEVSEIAGEVSPEGVIVLEEEPMVACNYRACSQAYRSFRPADCTYQPFEGPRRLCEM